MFIECSVNSNSKILDSNKIISISTSEINKNYKICFEMIHDNQNVYVWDYGRNFDAFEKDMDILRRIMKIRKLCDI